MRFKIQAGLPESRCSGFPPSPARLFQPSRSVHLRRGSCGCPVRISLVEPRGVTPRPRNFDTEPPSSYCYELQSDRRWESVANVHAAAGLRVRLWLSIRAEVKALGAANSQVIACRILRATAVEENCMPTQLPLRAPNKAAAFAFRTQGSESARRFETTAAPSNSARLLKKNFIKCLRLSGRRGFFKVLVCALPISD